MVSTFATKKNSRPTSLQMKISSEGRERYKTITSRDTHLRVEMVSLCEKREILLSGGGSQILVDTEEGEGETIHKIIIILHQELKEQSKDWCRLVVWRKEVGNQNCWQSLKQKSENEKSESLKDRPSKARYENYKKLKTEATGFPLICQGRTLEENGT